jgi:hypothetical protein
MHKSARCVGVGGVYGLCYSIQDLNTWVRSSDLRETNSGSDPAGLVVESGHAGVVVEVGQAGVENGVNAREERGLPRVLPLTHQHLRIFIVLTGLYLRDEWCTSLCPRHCRIRACCLGQ